MAVQRYRVRIAGDWLEEIKYQQTFTTGWSGGLKAAPIEASISGSRAVAARQRSVPDIIEAFRDWAARLPDTVGVFVVSGSEDFLIHVAVADNQHLYAFVIDKLTERPEVADVRTSVIYEHLRNHAVAPATGP